MSGVPPCRIVSMFLIVLGPAFVLQKQPQHSWQKTAWLFRLRLVFALGVVYPVVHLDSKAPIIWELSVRSGDHRGNWPVKSASTLGDSF